MEGGREKSFALLCSAWNADESLLRAEACGPWLPSNRRGEARHAPSSNTSVFRLQLRCIEPPLVCPRVSPTSRSVITFHRLASIVLLAVDTSTRNLMSSSESIRTYSESSPRSC